MTDSIHSYANEVFICCHNVPPRLLTVPCCLSAWYPPGLGLRKDILVNLHHEVSSRQKLSNKAGVAGGLEAGKERQQEGVPCTTHSLQDPLLTVQAAREDMGWDLMDCALTPIQHLGLDECSNS